jgi:hypothetical protein
MEELRNFHQFVSEFLGPRVKANAAVDKARIDRNASDTPFEQLEVSHDDWCIEQDFVRGVVKRRPVHKGRARRMVEPAFPGVWQVIADTAGTKVVFAKKVPRAQESRVISVQYPAGLTEIRLKCVGPIAKLDIAAGVYHPETRPPFTPNLKLRAGHTIRGLQVKYVSGKLPEIVVSRHPSWDLDDQSIAGHKITSKPRFDGQFQPIGVDSHIV